MKALQTRVFSNKNTYFNESDSENENEDFNDNFTPWSKDQSYVIGSIKRSFKAVKGPPKTELSFYWVGKCIGKGKYGWVNVVVHKLAMKLQALKTINKKIVKT